LRAITGMIKKPFILWISVVAVPGEGVRGEGVENCG